MNKKVLIIIVILLGVFLRVYNLDSQSLWSDEGYSINEAKFSVSEIFSHMDYNPNPPLYLTILHFWIKIFGDSAFSVRFLSVIFSSFSLFLIFILAKNIANEKTAILSTLFLSLSTFHIYYAQEARSYALFTMLGLFSYYFFYKYIKDNTKKNMFFYIFSTTLMIYTHIFGIFIIISQTLSVKKKLIKKWFLILSLLGILYLPYIGVLYQQAIHVSSQSWRTVPGISYLIYTLSRHSGNHLLLGIFLILTTYYLIKSKETWMKRSLVFWWMVSTILPFIISITLFPMFFSKYTIVSSLGLYILGAKGIEKIKSKRLKYGAIFLLLLLLLSQLIYHQSTTKKEDWRSVSKYLDENVGEIDRIIFYPGFTDSLMYQYYTEENHTTYVLTYSTRKLNNSDLERITPMLGEYENMWLVLSHNQFDKRLIQHINSSYGRISQKNFTGIQVYKFSQK